MPTDKVSHSLQLIRAEIDAIDDQILDLLGKRYEVTAKVRASKAADAKPVASPLRPSREVDIMRRLLAKRGKVNPELLVRLWRQIIMQSTLEQEARITIHISRHLNANTAARLMMRDWFGAVPVEEYRDEDQALFQVEAQPTDIGVVETTRNWAKGFMAFKGSQSRVIARLPALAKEDPVPQLLVFAQVPVAPTGDDETLVVSKGRLPRDFPHQPLWQATSGEHHLTALSGFFTEHEGPFVALTRSNPALGLRIAGAYSRPINL